jgi:hypothetical protein
MDRFGRMERTTVTASVELASRTRYCIVDGDDDDVMVMTLITLMVLMCSVVWWGP